MSNEAGVGPLLLATLPWGIQIAEGRLSWKRTPFDLAIAVIALTGIIGYLAGYDRVFRWSSLWLIALTITLYYVTSRRSIQQLWLMLDGWMVASASLALYFLLSHDWSAYPTDFRWLQAFGLRWTELRPDLGLETFEPNIVGGVLAVVLPVILAVLVRGLRLRQRSATIIRLFSLVVSVFGIIVSSSRGAWLALAIGLLIGFLWIVFSVVLRRLRLATFIKWSALMLLPSLVLGIWVLTIIGSGLSTELDTLIPGAASAQSRVGLTWDAVRLLQDYPFTGSGLASFPGQYSHYIRYISEYYFGYAHNLYVDIALSQGPFAVAAMIVVLVGAIWLLVDVPANYGRILENTSLLRAAIVSGLIITLVHGFFDDPLYVSRGILLLLFFPAAACAIHRELHPENLSVNQGRDHKPKGWYVLSVTVIVLMGVSMVIAIVGDPNPRSLQSAFISNRAALGLARRELADFPEGVVIELRDLAGDRIQRERLQRSLALEGSNRTAFHRLGLMALRNGDFEGAAVSLENAARLDPDHPGIVKALGFTYVWLGDFEGAYALLDRFPGVSNELEGYAHWWSTTGRPDLARNALRMAAEISD